MNETTPPLVQPPDPGALSGVYQFIAERAVEALRFDGEVLPTLLMMSLPPGAKEPVAVTVIDPRLVHALQRDGTRKNALMALVRSLLDAAHPAHASAAEQMGAHPNLIAHVSESWLVKKRIDEGGGSLATFEGSLADHPERTEAIMIALHSLRGTLIGTCPMTRDAAGKASAVIEPLEIDPTELRGRFAVNEDSRELPANGIAFVAVQIDESKPQ
jgi:hypothetical protein